MYNAHYIDWIKHTFPRDEINDSKSETSRRYMKYLINCKYKQTFEYLAKY